MARRTKATRGGVLPKPKKKKKWPWVVGGLLAVGAMAGGGEEGTDTVTQTEVAQEAPAPAAQPQALVSEVPTEPEQTDPAPEPAEPEAPDAADLLALGSTPEALPSLDYSVDGDRQYYDWDRPDLGREVKTVYIAPDDWWVEISDPTFHASELGDLESVTDQVGRYTSGPLAGALVIQNSAIHLWSQKYYDRDHAPVQEPEPVAEPVAEPTSPTAEAPAMVEQSAEVQPAYDAPAEQLFFANCSEARAAGYSNMTPGQPGYSLKLDRDGDGLACES